jgi:hypothetical protein
VTDTGTRGQARRGAQASWELMLTLARFVVVALGAVTLAGLAAGIVGAFQSNPAGVGSNQVRGVVLDYSTEWAGIVVAALLFVALGLLWYAVHDLAGDQTSSRPMRVGAIGRARTLGRVTGLLFITNAVAAIGAVVAVAYVTGLTGPVELDWTRYTVSGGLALASVILAVGGQVGTRRLLALCDAGVPSEPTTMSAPPPLPPDPPFSPGTSFTS